MVVAERVDERNRVRFVFNFKLSLQPLSNPRLARTSRCVNSKHSR